MKKNSIPVIALTLIALLITTMTAQADLPGTGWWSAIFVQNIAAGSTDGGLTMVAYDSSSALTYSSNAYSFDYGQALVYDPGKSVGGAYIGFADSPPSGFEGSVVLSADVPVAAISEIANYNHGSVGGGGTATARYQGIGADAVSTRLTVPTIKSNFQNHTTTLYVQAAGQEANVTVTFNMNDGNEYPLTQIIEQNKMFVFAPSDAGVPTDLCGTNGNESPCYGSAVIVSSTGPIAATVVEHPHSGSPAGYALSTRAQSENDQDTILYHPTVKNSYYHGSIAGVSVMNVGSAPAYVQIKLSVTGVRPGSAARVGNEYTDHLVIEPGKSQLFGKWRDTLGGMPTGTFAAATIESLSGEFGGVVYTPQPLVGATNDSKYISVPGGKGITLYAGFANKSADNILYAPIVRENFESRTGGLTIQNVGTTAAYISYTYYEYGTENVYEFRTTNMLEPGQAINPNNISSETNGTKFTIINNSFQDFSEMANKQFSVVAESTQPIIGLASEYSPAQNYDMANYEAINYVP